MLYGFEPLERRRLMSVSVPPVAVNDTGVAYSGVTAAISVLGNDQTDSAFNLSSVTVVTPPGHGTAVPDFSTASNLGQGPPIATGEIDYTPAAGFTGTDSFTYKVSDVNGLISNPATVTVTVAEPPAPVAGNQTIDISRFSDQGIGATGNVAYPDTPTSLAVVTEPAHGSVVVTDSGLSILYTPDGDYVGSDSFTYDFTDLAGAVSTPGTVEVTVSPVPPVATDSAVLASSDGPTDLSPDVTEPGAGVTGPATASIVDPPAHGSAVADADGDITYTPVAGYTGTDALTYTVDDSFGDVSNPATITLDVVKPQAFAANLAATTDNLLPVSIDLMNTSDSYGYLQDPATGAYGESALSDAATAIVTGPSHGTVALSPDGTATYTPEPTFIGTDTFTYTVGDGYGSVSPPATVTITVSPSPTPTAAAPVTVAASGPAATIDPAAGVITGIPLAATTTAVTVDPVDGTAVVQPSGSILYTADPGFAGTDSLTYTVADIDGNLSTPITTSVDVPVTLTSPAGSPRRLVLTDASGGRETLTLDGGTARIFFTGTAAVSPAGARTVIAAGNPLEIASIELTGTTAGSSLSIAGPARSPLTIGGITDSSPLGSIVAPAAILTGTATLASVSDIRLLSVSDGAVDTTGPARTPVTVAIPTGLDSSLTTTQTIRSFKSSSWSTDASASHYSAAVTAPVIDSLSIGGDFAGGVTADTSAGNLVFPGGLNGAIITAGSVKLFKVVGNFTNADLHVGTAGSIVVTGTIESDHTAAISSTGDIGSVTAGNLLDSAVTVGVTGDGLSLATVTAAGLGSSTLGLLRITGRGTAGIVDSSVFAGTIRSASVGEISAGNGGVPQGVAAAHLGAVSGIFADHPLSVPAKETASATALAAYLKTKGYSLGDFEFDVVS